MINYNDNNNNENRNCIMSDRGVPTFSFPVMIVHGFVWQFYIFTYVLITPTNLLTAANNGTAYLTLYNTVVQSTRYSTVQ